MPSAIEAERETVPVVRSERQDGLSNARREVNQRQGVSATGLSQLGQ